MAPFALVVAAAAVKVMTLTLTVLPVATVKVNVKPSTTTATLSGAMNGAGMEELNHEIYGGVYSQLIHGESFEEPVGTNGVSGQSFHNTWSASRGKPGDDGNSTYITWQPMGNAAGCGFNSSSTSLNGNASQSVSCTAGTRSCSCAIVNRGVDATGFYFDRSTKLEGYLFARQLAGTAGSAVVSVVVDLISESARGGCGAAQESNPCPVLASQTFTLSLAAVGHWQRLNISLSGIQAATTCKNDSGVGPHDVRCVGQFGGGNPSYFPVEGHMYEEDVCITCSGSVRLSVTSPAGATVLLDQFFLSPASVYGGDLVRLPARPDVGEKSKYTGS